MRILAVLLFVPIASAQSLWLEAGLGYRENPDTGLYTVASKVGLRLTAPLGEPYGPGLFVALAWQGGLVLDAGGWFAFAPGPTDPFGLLSHAGVGLSYAAGSVGLALAAAVSYELRPGLDLALSFTFRPLLLPQLSQAFDTAIGVRLTFD
jgi:hypothetical protein